MIQHTYCGALRASTLRDIIVAVQLVIEIEPEVSKDQMDHEVVELLEADGYSVTYDKDLVLLTDLNEGEE